MTTKFNRILFDYDGTLILHDKENEGRQIAEILNISEDKIPEFSRRLKCYFGTPFGRTCYKNKKMNYTLHNDILDIVIDPTEFGITVKELDEAINNKSIYGSALEPTAIETLEYLTEKGYQLCVFTNGFLAPQVENMKYKGIYKYFERVYAWDDYYAKPDKRALIRALDRTNPDKNIMVGDSLSNDIAPAKKLGVYTVGINIGEYKHQRELPDKIINTLSELKTFL